MLKKSLIFAVITAILISPFLPRVNANSGEWHSAISDKVWDYGSYKVERLAFEPGVQGPYDFSDTVFFTKEANGCASKDICRQVDISIAKQGDILNISDVNEDIVSRFWHLSQNDKFVYFTEAVGKYNWFTAFQYQNETKSINKLTALERKDNEIKFNSFATEGTRLYASLIQTDKNNGDVEPSLLVKDFETGYERRDFSWLLTAPWQEILDVRGDTVLVKFQFEGGSKQLWLIDERTRSMRAIPETWTEEQGDIVAAHFKSNGVVEYFKNYRLFTFDPSLQSKPVEHGGVYLNWFAHPDKTIQISGDRTAWIDSENNLYVSDLNGVSKFGVVQDNQFTLLKDAIYFVTENENKGYNFTTKKWSSRDYHVTDSDDDVLVGIDKNYNIWYENITTNKLVNIGFGANPVLSDREHAYWRGMDGSVYQVSFSVLLDVSDIETPYAYKSYDNSVVYLFQDNKFWKVKDEQVYFSWFDSWSSVAEVTDAVMNLYLEKYGIEGDATFSPGTKIKAVENPRVYVMGKDRKLHWVVSETVAHSIYGTAWNKNIVEVPVGYLWRYATGNNLNIGSDIKSI